MATFSGWEAALLKALKAPATKANIAWLDAWQKTEGGTAAFNPLNTTQPVAGSSDYNSVGVKNYPSAAAGVHATAQTLLNGRYSAIVAALRSGDPTTYVFSNANKQGAAGNPVVSQLGVWGSHGFASEVGSNEVPGVSSSSESVGSSASDAGKTASDVTGGIFGGFESWLSGVGKKVLAYLLLGGLAAGLFLTGLKGLGVKPPKLPVVVPE